MKTCLNSFVNCVLGKSITRRRRLQKYHGKYITALNSATQLLHHNNNNDNNNDRNESKVRNQEHDAFYLYFENLAIVSIVMKIYSCINTRRKFYIKNFFAVWNFVIEE